MPESRRPAAESWTRWSYGLQARARSRPPDRLRDDAPVMPHGLAAREMAYRCRSANADHAIVPRLAERRNPRLAGSYRLSDCRKLAELIAVERKSTRGYQRIAERPLRDESGVYKR